MGRNLKMTKPQGEGWLTPAKPENATSVQLTSFGGFVFLFTDVTGRNKCIYYIVLSDQDATMAFLSSLFFSFMFIKLTRYADGRPNGRCDVPVNLILDEFNNVGRIVLSLSHRLHLCAPS